MKRNLKAVTIWSFLVLTPFLSFGQDESTSKESASIGTYSISLNVADISKSLEFYQKLGFEPLDGAGSIEQKWMILSNGSTKIGLFQGLFPSNTITFNPEDGRSAYNVITESGIEPTFQLGMDQESGPCTFSIVDPDGNPILIDQH